MALKSHGLKDKDIQKMKKLDEKGWSHADIGRALGVSRQTVRYWLGASGRPPGVQPAATPKEVADMAWRGWSDERISRKTGLSLRTVRELRNIGGFAYKTGPKPKRKKK